MESDKKAREDHLAELEKKREKYLKMLEEGPVVMGSQYRPKKNKKRNMSIS